jgi:hypothetical protein
VRVPTTCDALLTQHDVEGLVGETAILTPPPQFRNPVFYTDVRIGSLRCGWSSGADSALPGSLTLDVVPDVTAEGYASVINGEAWASTDPDTDIGPEAHSECGSTGCSFVDLVNGYGVTLRAAPQGVTDLTDEGRATLRALFVSIVGQIAALGPPAALWQPTGANLTGASSCDTLIDPDTLSADFGGAEISVFKAEEGEYAQAPFGTNLEVGAYWCSWTVDGEPGPSAFVLPGGASYFEGAREWETLTTWHPTSDYPGEAYLSDNGLQVTMLINGGWIQVGSPTAELLPSLVDTVLHNVGAE